jgi:aldehyde dehydrogenase (NAD+)
MMSFTGSTRAGISIAQESAPSVKRVAQELGGKSPNIILDDADFDKSVAKDTFMIFMNTGQSCNAPTRMLVPADRMEEAAAIAKATAESLKVGDPTDKATKIGPMVSKAQYNTVQEYIQKGIDEGAKLVTGGLGHPDGLETGYFAKLTVFSEVSNDMTIAQEEIFGPVLAMIPYKDEDEAVEIANDTVYGLSAYVSSGDLERAKSVGARLRAGNVHLNGAQVDMAAPFGGYKQSGNGREFGKWGLEEFLETKALLGFTPKD